MSRSSRPHLPPRWGRRVPTMLVSLTLAGRTELLDDPVRAEGLGRNGFQRLDQMFTAERYQQRVKEHLQKVVT